MDSFNLPKVKMDSFNLPKEKMDSFNLPQVKMDNLNLTQEKLNTLKDELRHLLNRLSIDNELGTPDFILAEMITEQINSMVVAKRKTLELAGESLKTIQLEFQGVDEVVKDEEVEEEPFHIVGSVWMETWSKSNRKVKVTAVDYGKTFFKYLDNDYNDHALTSNFLKDFVLCEDQRKQ